MLITHLSEQSPRMFGVAISPATLQVASRAAALDIRGVPEYYLSSLRLNSAHNSSAVV